MSASIVRRLKGIVMADEAADPAKLSSSGSEEEEKDNRKDDLFRSAGEGIISNLGALFDQKCGIRFDPDQIRFPAMRVGSTAQKELTIYNYGLREWRMKGFRFTQDASACQFELKTDREEPDGGGVTILRDDNVKFTVICRPLMVGRMTATCVFDFGAFSIARKFCVTGMSDLEEKLPVEPPSQTPAFRKKVCKEDIQKMLTDRERRQIRSSGRVRSPFFSKLRLPSYEIPKEAWDSFHLKNEKIVESKFPDSLSVVTLENYKVKFMVSLWFEEMQQYLMRRRCDMENVTLTRMDSRNSRYFTFHAPMIHEIQPPVSVKDSIDVFYAKYPESVKFQGTILKIHDDSRVTCVFSEAFDELYTDYPLTVQFALGRTTYKRCHFAVETAVDYLGKQVLFPEEEEVGALKPPRILIYKEGTTSAEGTADVSVPIPKEVVSGRKPSKSIFNKQKPLASRSSNTQSPSSMAIGAMGKRMQSCSSRFVSDTPSSPSCTTAKLEWFNTNLNDEQRDAVCRILEGRARPCPYIIFGPPGTGKTVTLVEAIMQLNKLDKNSRILVCAPSNAAADIIAELLANSKQYLPGEFVRLNGFLRAGQPMIKTIEPFCVDGDNLQKVAMHKLIISTCITAGQFFNLDLSHGHFTHVFIDEAGYCTEPEAMIPTVLLALSKGGQLILAGDPNQLGPVLMCDVAENCGLGRSFLERLMTRKLYCRDSDRFPKEKYNPLVLTRLVKNYRAHPALLKLPSGLFYDDDLEAKASFEDAYSLCEDTGLRDILVKQGVPLIFHGIQGDAAREGNSPSWCNKREALTVLSYVAKLRDCGVRCADIGIITPYRKQVEKIRLALEMNLYADELPLLKVASVEEFQGGERKVIIISTVRSLDETKIDENLERLSFLYQPKRFNVAITRAKALMIVVGNPHVLARNNYWFQFLQYVNELDAYIGCDMPPQLDKNIRRILQHEEERDEDIPVESIPCNSSMFQVDDDDDEFF